MKSIIESVFAEDPPAVVLGELEVATVSGEELLRAARLLEKEHYLGAARPVGRTLVVKEKTARDTSKNTVQGRRREGRPSGTGSGGGRGVSCFLRSGQLASVPQAGP